MTTTARPILECDYCGGFRDTDPGPHRRCRCPRARVRVRSLRVGRRRVTVSLLQQATWDGTTSRQLSVSVSRRPRP